MEAKFLIYEENAKEKRRAEEYLRNKYGPRCESIGFLHEPQELYSLLRRNLREYTVLLFNPGSADECLRHAEQILGLRQRTTGILPVKTGRATYQVPLDDIRYLSKDKRKVRVHTVYAEYEFYGKLTELGDSLGDRFLCCHKSYVVNLEMVHSRMERSFCIDGGEILPISQKRFQETRRYYENFLAAKAGK